MVPEVQKPSQEPCIAFYPKRRIRNLLREKHFHGVSSGSRHEYLLKLRYGKVSAHMLGGRDTLDIRCKVHALLLVVQVVALSKDKPILDRIMECREFMHVDMIDVLTPTDR